MQCVKGICIHFLIYLVINFVSLIRKHTIISKRKHLLHFTTKVILIKVLWWAIFILQNLRFGPVVQFRVHEFFFVIFLTILSRIKFRFYKRVKNDVVSIWFCFINFQFIWNYNSFPAQMCMLCIALIEIAHRRTYIQWLCSQHFILFFVFMKMGKPSFLIY